MFNSVLTSTQIQRIFTNQNAGNNYDGSTRSCPVPAIPLLEYRFEEESWNGSPDEILDNTGNGHHAQVNNNSTPQTTLPALTGDPGTCGYASQNDGSIQVTGLPIDTVTHGVKTTVTFWMNWDGTNSVMPIGWNLHDIWLISGSIGFNTFSSDIYGISSAGLANGWHHVAVEFTNGNVTNNRMYIDGVEQVLTQRRGSINNARAFVNAQMRIGGVSNSASYNFHGLLDEFKVYENALTTAQVNTIMNEVHPCIPVVDHYQITHDGNGLTCAPENVLIRACSDANCNSFNNTINTTVTMQVNGGADQNITIVNGSSVNETFVYIDPDNPAVLSLTSDYSCSDTSDNSAGCAVNFAKAGFLLNLDNHQSCTTPNLTIKAVRFIGSGLDCVPAYTGNQSVDFVFNYANPSSGYVLPVLNGMSMVETVPQIRTVHFDNTGTANLSFNYQDAGQIRINVSDAAAAGLTASSVTAVVTPAKLIVASPDANADCANGDATCSAFKAAGAPFKLDITAACSNNTVTKNFIMDDNIPLTITTIAPNVANPVTLGVTSINMPATDKGIHKTSNQTISEVGVFTITATPPRYFNETIPAAVSANIGRFIPDHFELTTGFEGELKSVCDMTSPSSEMTFAYVGQMSSESSGEGALQYELEPTLLITAKSKAGLNGVSSTTKNYREDFMMLSVSDVKYIIPIEDAEKIGALGVKVKLTANVSDGSLSGENGVITYAFNTNDNFIYLHEENSETIPFPAKIELGIDSVEDADDVVAIDGDGDTDNGRLWVLKPIEKEIRFGRANLENSFGPETSPLGQVLSVEYYDGTNFVLADDDTCTQYNSANVSFGPINSVGLNSANIPTVSGTFIALDDLPNGVTRQIILPAVAAGNQGEVEVIYTIYPWLQYDWHWNGVEVKTFDENPSAIATFGLYRGNDRIIYSREVFN